VCIRTARVVRKSPFAHRTSQRTRIEGLTVSVSRLASVTTSDRSMELENPSFRSIASTMPLRTALEKVKKVVSE
jgi:hypothetical protein